MTHVIIGTCCNDSACVFACPVNCIHPVPGEPGYGNAELLFIDPDACIDCGACVDACPVHATVPDYDLEDRDQPFADLARAWFAVEEKSTYPQEQQRLPVMRVTEPSALRVAVIGTGPAACYAIDALAVVRGLSVEVTVVERLLAPGGLVRYGVAPDHPETKVIGEQFLRTLARPSVSLHLGVEVGRDVTIEQLAASHDAVIVGSGAAAGRHLGISGDDLAGVISAVDFVGWYNGHPDYADLAIDLSGERAVVIGNGNVAIDVARVLLSGADQLRRTDIAEHALEALAASSVREVILAGRRGIEHAAFTASELEGLARVPGLCISAESEELEPTVTDLSPQRRVLVEHKASRLREIAGGAGEGPTLTFRFRLRPRVILGDGKVASVRFDSRTGPEEVDAGLLLTSIGYQGVPIPGLPFDDERGVIPNEKGRVIGRPGLYVVGWVKRGPSGGIGTNRWCAAETVAALLEDVGAGRLGGGGLDQPIDALQDAPGLAEWRALDRSERELGRGEGRPRVKIVEAVRQREMMS